MKSGEKFVESDPKPVEAEPAEAEVVFGAQIGAARKFTSSLGELGEKYGLIGPLEAERLWSRHILNSAVIAPLFVAGARVGDVGSGAGLPGLVLAIARPDVQWVLIEPMERRVRWLTDQADELELANVEVVRARAEEVDADLGLDQVTARAVSALRTLIPLTVPLLRVGGELVLLKGEGAAAEIEKAEKVIRRFKLTDVRVEVVGEDLLPVPSRVIRATRSA